MSDVLPLIAQFLVEKECASSGGRQITLSPEVLSLFMDYPWPGNIRELQNAITDGCIPVCDREAVNDGIRVLASVEIEPPS